VRFGSAIEEIIDGCDEDCGRGRRNALFQTSADRDM
jgi:hypothetical protein